MPPIQLYMHITHYHCFLLHFFLLGIRFFVLKFIQSRLITHYWISMTFYISFSNIQNRNFRWICFDVVITTACANSSVFLRKSFASVLNLSPVCFQDMHLLFLHRVKVVWRSAAAKLFINLCSFKLRALISLVDNN